MQQTDSGTAPAATRRRSVDAILLFHGLSSFCYGMVFPFTGIYLAARPGIGTSGVAVYYAVSGVSNVAVSLVLATGLVKLSRAALGVLGLCLSVTCFLLLPIAASMPTVAGAAIGGGAGQGCFMAAIIPIVNALVPPEQRRQVFARRYQILNGTLASGSLVAGLFMAGFSRSAIPYFFVVNALGYLPIAATLVFTRKLTRPAESPEPAASASASDASDGGVARTGQLPLRTLLKLSLGAALFQFGAYLFGYSQFEATAPLVADRLMGTGLGWISAMLTVNVVVLVLLQGRVTKLLEHRTEAFGLRVAIALWVAGFLLVGSLAFAPFALQLTGLLLYAALFGLGEAAFSCSYHPWLISKVPDQELTRASALCNSMMGVGTFLGPSVGVSLLAFGNPAAVWLPLAAGCALVGLTTVRLVRRPPAEAPVPADQSMQSAL